MWINQHHHLTATITRHLRAHPTTFFTHYDRHTTERIIDQLLTTYATALAAGENGLTQRATVLPLVHTLIDAGCTLYDLRLLIDTMRTAILATIDPDATTERVLSETWLYHLLQHTMMSYIIQREAIIEQQGAELEIRYAELQTAHQALQTLAETALVAREEAERANRLKSDFLARISHELRTPLNPLINYPKLIPHYGPLNAEQESLLSIVAARGEHLLALINDILDMAKIESGTFHLVWEDVDLTTLCHETIATIMPLASNKGLQVHTDITAGLPPMRGERKRMRQILLNILTNAIKFTDHGSVRLHVTAVADMLHIRLVDTGIGMNPHGMARIFTPYEQLQTGLIRPYDGVGLGLPITKHLIDLHNGTIQVFSTVGIGTTVLIAMPTAQSLRHEE